MSKLTKEQCLEALNELEGLEIYDDDSDGNVCYDSHYKVEDLCSFETLQQLINEHFELKEKYSKILDDCHDYRHETHAIKMTVRNLMEHFGVSSEEELKNIYLNKSYEFEDLKAGMWVWDDEYKWYVEIHGTNIDKDGLKTVDVYLTNSYIITLIFKENMFYSKEVKSDE